MKWRILKTAFRGPYHVKNIWSRAIGLPFLTKGKPLFSMSLSGNICQEYHSLQNIRFINSEIRYRLTSQCASKQKRLSFFLKPFLFIDS